MNAEAIRQHSASLFEDVKRKSENRDVASVAVSLGLHILQALYEIAAQLAEANAYLRHHFPVKFPRWEDLTAEEQAAINKAGYVAVTKP